jgi:hypothetical protein
MKRSAAFIMAALLLALATVPPLTSAGPASESGLERLLDGDSAISLGFGVSPLRWQFAPLVPAMPGAQASERGRPVDLDVQGKAISFDLKLKWPGTETAVVEPYVAFGPAFFVEPDYVGLLRAPRADPTVRLGAKVGAGLNWRLGKDTTFFSAYEVTTAGPSGLLPGGAKRPADAGVGGYDLTYGFQFRY